MIFLLAMVLCVVAKSTANVITCPPPTVPFNGVCARIIKKRSVEYCPPCIPVDAPPYYRLKCPDTRTCATRQQRSVEYCPPCIPYQDMEAYMARNECLSKPVCLSRRQRSLPCPPCLPITDVKIYQNDCPGVPVCSRKKRQNPCPMCIPFGEKNDACTKSGTPTCS